VGKRNGVIAAIGVFKLIKAALLIALGITGLAADPSDLAHRVRHLVSWMGIFTGSHALGHLISKLNAFNDHEARQRLPCPLPVSNRGS
jgi:hypothetical protein